jgi:uncharacterized protein
MAHDDWVARPRIGYGIAMHFTQDQTGGVNLIRGYVPGELRVNDNVLRATLILAAHYRLALDEVGGVEDLAVRHAQLVLAQYPELVLVGSGTRQQFPGPQFLQPFASASIGIEIMSTAAACRTYNVLISERRAAIALLIL